MTGKIIPMRGALVKHRQPKALTAIQRRAVRAWLRELTIGEVYERALKYGNPVIAHGGRA
jgi:hypothetical protein